MLTPYLHSLDQSTLVGNFINILTLNALITTSTGPDQTALLHRLIWICAVMYVVRSISIWRGSLVEC